MSKLPPWRGVRLATHDVGLDPDAPPHRVAVPVGWGEDAARGLLGLAGAPDEAGGWEKLALPDAAARWIAPVEAASPGSGAVLHASLLHREACPDEPVWTGTANGGEAGFAINLASFADEDGLDNERLDAAIAAAAGALMSAGAVRRLVRLAGLDGLLAAHGLDYDTAEARALAGRVVRRARAALRRADPAALLAAGHAGAAEALLGVETAHVAPAFSHVDADGRLTVAAAARLAGRRLSPERALAMALEGRAPLSLADAAAHALMHDALAPLFDLPPPPPVPHRAPAAPAAPRHRTLPARHRGWMEKITIGGHRVVLRTGEYEDGTLGEVSLALGGREGSLGRGLAEAVGTAISVGLQHGVPLDAFVHAFSHGRFGPAGAVEGDGAIRTASSPLDYTVRALAETYGGRLVPDPAAAAPHDEELPLGLPAPAPPRRRPALRLVGGAA